MIEMYRNRESLPEVNQFRAQTKMMELETGRRIERLAITSDYIRNFEYDFRLIPNPQAETSKALDKALTLEKTRVYMEFFPDLIDREEAAVTVAEKFGDDPTRVLRKDLFENPPAQLPAPGQEGGQGNMTMQMMKGASQDQMGSLAMRDLAKT